MIPSAPGVYYTGVPFDDYKRIDAVNFSTLKILNSQTPAHYHAAITDEGGEEDPTKYVIGKLAHSLVLEGKDLRAMFAVKPIGMRFNTKDGKAWRDSQTLPILTQEESESIPGIAEALSKDPAISDMIRRSAHREVTVISELGGVKLKCRLDAIFTDESGRDYIPDLKTCLDASERGFSRTIAERDYHMQAHLYRSVWHKEKGGQFPGYVWWAVEKTKPFCPQAWFPQPDVEEAGRKDVERALTTLQRCVANGEWPAYGGGVKGISLPHWKIKKSEDA